MTRVLALAAVAVALIAGGAHAQGRPKPEDPAAPAAPLGHASAFEGYRAFADEPLAPWRAVNDEVGRVGGHAGVLRAEERKPAPPAAAPAPAAGHRMPPEMHRDPSQKK